MPAARHTAGSSAGACFPRSSVPRFLGFLGFLGSSGSPGCAGLLTCGERAFSGSAGEYGDFVSGSVRGDVAIRTKSRRDFHAPVRRAGET